MGWRGFGWNGKSVCICCTRAGNWRMSGYCFTALQSALSSTMPHQSFIYWQCPRHCPGLTPFALHLPHFPVYHHVFLCVTTRLPRSCRIRILCGVLGFDSIYKVIDDTLIINYSILVLLLTYVCIVYFTHDVSKDKVSRYCLRDIFQYVFEFFPIRLQLAFLIN